MFQMKKRIAAASMALMLMAGTAVSPAAAQSDNQQKGLVNVNVQVTDVIEDITVSHNNVTVAAAASIVAQVCGTNVGVAALLAFVQQAGAYHCESRDGDATVDVTN